MNIKACSSDHGTYIRVRSVLNSSLSDWIEYWIPILGGLWNTTDSDMFQCVSRKFESPSYEIRVDPKKLKKWAIQHFLKTKPA